MSFSNKSETVAEKLKKLDELLAWFESDEISVEEALIKYEQTLKLAGEVETQLKDAKNKVEVIKKKFSQ